MDFNNSFKLLAVPEPSNLFAVAFFRYLANTKILLSNSENGESKWDQNGGSKWDVGKKMVKQRNSLAPEKSVKVSFYEILKYSRKGISGEHFL